MCIHSDEFKRTKAEIILWVVFMKNNRQTLNRTLGNVERAIEMGQVTIYGTAEPENPMGNRLINQYFAQLLGEIGDSVTIRGARNGLIPLIGNPENNSVAFNVDPAHPGFSFTGTYLGLAVVRYAIGGNPIGEMPEFLIDHPESATRKIADEMDMLDVLPQPRRESLFEWGVVLSNVMVVNSQNNEFGIVGGDNHLVLHDWHSTLVNHSDENRDEAS